MMSLILLQQQQNASRTEAMRSESIARSLREGRRRRQARRRRFGSALGRHSKGGLAGSPPGAGGRLLQL